jgi:hypothetical protein
MHPSSIVTQNLTVATTSAHPNRRSRFVRKVRFGARQRDFSAVTKKIFLLPNGATGFLTRSLSLRGTDRSSIIVVAN